MSRDDSLASRASRASTVEHTGGPDAMMVVGAKTLEFLLLQSTRIQSASFFEPAFVHPRHISTHVQTSMSKMTDHLDGIRQVQEHQCPVMSIRSAMPAEWESSGASSESSIDDDAKRCWAGRAPRRFTSVMLDRPSSNQAPPTETRPAEQS